MLKKTAAAAREALRKDTALLRDSAAAVRASAAQADAEMKAGGWKMLWNALRGRPPALSPEAVSSLSKMRRLYGMTASVLLVYSTICCAYGFVSLGMSVYFIIIPCTAGFYICNAFLRGPRIPPDRWLEYQPVATLPPPASE